MRTVRGIRAGSPGHTHGQYTISGWAGEEGRGTQTWVQIHIQTL